MSDCVDINMKPILAVILEYFIYFCTIAVNVDNTLIDNNHVQYHLSDNTPADNRIGSVFNDLHLGRTIQRVILSSNNLFRLTTDGNLYTRSPLDRDQICHSIHCCELDFCQLSLEAYLFDNSPTPTTVNIDLLIADENDHPPVFPQEELGTTESNCSWNLWIPESAPVGSRYALPVATDEDSSRFGVRKYTLITVPSSDQQHSLLSLDPFSLLNANQIDRSDVPQLRLDSPLDRERQSKYYAKFVAEDAGSPALSATLNLCINIQDVNDNPPVFRPMNLTGDVIMIQENITIGSVIGHFIAYDLDDGPNKDIIYEIDWMSSSGSRNRSTLDKLSAKYSLHPETGELRVAQPLDYEDEAERKITLVIKAVDQGSPKLSASTSVTISLIDINDNDPRIDVMDVNEKDGIDATKPTGSEKFYENDFTSKLLKLVTVRDADSVSKDKVHCYLPEQYRGDFSLKAYSSTMYGLINLRAFDYEQEASQTGHISVRLECVDEASPSRTVQRWVQIKLEDVNDNWPQFDRSNYHFEVSEDAEIGYKIGQVRASDADSDGKVSYEMTSDDVDNLQYVQMDPESGMIYTVTSLDREKLASMKFRVTVKDTGDGGRGKGNVKTNTTGVTILIRDVNDNPPVYLGPSEVHIQENVPIGLEVIGLQFVDYDLGKNGSILLSVSQHSVRYTSPYKTNLPFTIVDNSRLVTTMELDREYQANYVIEIVAVDQGIPKPLSSTVSLTIRIDDVNDNQPELVYPKNQSLLYGNLATSDWVNTMATVPVDTPSGTLVGVIHGKDVDNGKNGTVSYELTPGRKFEEIIDGFPYFEMDSEKGHLTTRWGEQQPNHGNASGKALHPVNPVPGMYAIHVALCDQGLPKRCTPSVFYVNISEAVGGAFGIGLFSGMALSNTVMLVLISVCSLALIISLVAAIVWVRHRKDTQHQPTENGLNTNGGYFGPTVLCHENEHNGYYYSGYFPTVVNGSEYDSQAMLCEKDAILKPDNCVEFPPLLCTDDGTLHPVCLTAPQPPNCEINSTMGLVHDACQWFPVCSGTLNKTQNNSLWIKNTTDQGDKKCVTFGPAELVNHCQTTTNSAAESDSGVDIGTGVAMGVTNLGPLYASSAQYDPGLDGELCLAYSKHPSSIKHPSLKRGENPVLMFKKPLYSTMSRSPDIQHFSSKL